MRHKHRHRHAACMTQSCNLPNTSVAMHAIVYEQACSCVQMQTCATHPVHAVHPTQCMHMCTNMHALHISTAGTIFLYHTSIGMLAHINHVHASYYIHVVHVASVQTGCVLACMLHYRRPDASLHTCCVIPLHTCRITCVCIAVHAYMFMCTHCACRCASHLIVHTGVHTGTYRCASYFIVHTGPSLNLIGCLFSPFEWGYSSPKRNR
jgi:hypothetical protein